MAGSYKVVTWRNRTLDTLDQRHDVSFRVLEPRSLGAAGGRDAVLVHLRHVVHLELHAARLQLRDLPFDVLDLPKRLAPPRLAALRSRIQQTPPPFSHTIS